jgi:hypothetical protein
MNQMTINSILVEKRPYTFTLIFLFLLGLIALLLVGLWLVEPVVGSAGLTLPQQPTFYREMTPRQTLRFTADFFYTGPQTIIEERIEETLHLVGLQDKADRPIKGFSGGERQRLGIAQAQINYIFTGAPAPGMCHILLSERR